MILLVEDEEDDVFLMERALRKVPNAPAMQRVKNGQEAIDYLQGTGKYADRAAHPMPELIFLDLKLPFVHGFEVLNWIKNQPMLNDVHVVILTSSLEEVDRQRASRQGANGFYSKPPVPEQLREIFKSIPLPGFNN